jgi:hypothetical protein
VCPVRYELVFYIPEDDILHSHRREDLKSCNAFFVVIFYILFIILSVTPVSRDCKMSNKQEERNVSPDRYTAPFAAFHWRD